VVSLLHVCWIPPRGLPKKTETFRRITIRLYIIISNYSAVLRIYSTWWRYVMFSVWQTLWTITIIHVALFCSKEFYVHFHSSKTAALKAEINIIQPEPSDFESRIVFQMWERVTERRSIRYKYPDFNPFELVVLLPKITRKLTIETEWYTDLSEPGDVFSPCSEIQTAHKDWQRMPENTVLSTASGSAIKFYVQVHNLYSSSNY
jgi:hypothetical protein